MPAAYTGSRVGAYKYAQRVKRVNHEIINTNRNYVWVFLVIIVIAMCFAGEEKYC